MTTKSRFLKLVSIAFISLGMMSCAQDLLELEGEYNGGAASFTAYTESTDSKTVLDGNVSKWKGEESIQVIGKKGSYKFTASVNGQSSSATFSLDGSGSYNETEVMAVYPYASGGYVGDFAKMTVSNVSVPSVQSAVAGSYDPNAAVAVAHATGTTLNFKNAVSLLKFTMGSAGVKNVTIYGEMSEVEIETEVAQEGVLYVTLPNEWKSDNAWFAAYFFGNGTTWKRLTSVTGQPNMYSCERPEGYTSVIFVRMDPSKPELGWGSKWNQTVDLSLSDYNHFTFTKPWGGPEDKATGNWTTYIPVEKTTVPLGISGTGTVAYNGGAPTVSGFSEGYVSLNGDFQRGKTYYITVAPAVFEKGFTMEFSDVGDYDKYAVKSTTKRVEFKRNTIHDLGTVFSGKDEGFYTVPALPNADEPCTIYYTAPQPEGDADKGLYGYTGDVYVHTWIRNGSQDSHGPTWGDNSEKYKMTPVGDNTWSMTIEPSIREWFNEVLPVGTTPVQRIGILARSADKTIQTDDNFLTVVDDLYGVEMPEGLQHGINYIDNNTVTLVLYDRDNQGKSHDFCNLLWDDNWWGDSSKPKKSLNYDSDSGCWWITLTDLNPDKQYKFQYQLGYGSNVTVTTFDPYTEIVYDRSNDEWISDYAYPGLMAEYGNTHYGRDNGFVSAFKINKDVYDWKVKDYDIEDKDDLIIYELLVRDFTDNAYGEGCLNAIMDREWESGKNWLDYLQNLGVNAIELMPIQEFDGNDSWGYGNHAYFAMDKVYGNRVTVKKFIDECHHRGMAVILDVVYNHATGAHPYAAMYWDGGQNKTASNNPWFNVDAPHAWSVYHDWNHSNPMVREHIKRNLTYLMTEYKIDGFRFDLTKGFTQTNLESYEQNRVDYLKEYNAHILSVDESAVMICEHFVDDENYELGKDGIKVWRNMNDSYTKAMKRDMSVADFSGTTNTYDGNSGMMGDWQTFGQYVGYMESHDEERTGYAGQWDYSGSTIPFATRIERAKINAAFFLLSPGPKMIWQFGEIGYDISIEENGRTGKKPYNAPDYLKVAERKALYDTYSMLLKFRRDKHRFFDSDVNFRWYVGGGEQTGRYLFARSGEGKHFALFGNFGSGSKSIGVQLPEGVSKWYQYDNGKEWNGSNHTVPMAEGQFYILVSDPNLCLK